MFESHFKFSLKSEHTSQTPTLQKKREEAISVCDLVRNHYIVYFTEIYGSQTMFKYGSLNRTSSRILPTTKHECAKLYTRSDYCVAFQIVDATCTLITDPKTDLNGDFYIISYN